MMIQVNHGVYVRVGVAGWRLLVLLVVVLFPLAGCGDRSPQLTGPTAIDQEVSRGGLVNGMAAVAIEEGAVGALASHQSGERLGVLAQRGPDGRVARVTGAVLLLPGQGELVVYAGPDGLPLMAVADDVVIRFSSYTQSTVDLAVVTTAGTTATAMRVPIDPNLLSDLRAWAENTGQSTTPSSVGVDLANVDSEFDLALGLKIAGTLLSAAGCGIAVAGLSPAAGISLAFAGACVSLVADAATLLVPDLDSPALAFSSSLLSAADCLSYDYLGCAGGILGALQTAESDAKDFVQALFPTGSPDPSPEPPPPTPEPPAPTPEPPAPTPEPPAPTPEPPAPAPPSTPAPQPPMVPDVSGRWVTDTHMTSRATGCGPGYYSDLPRRTSGSMLVEQSGASLRFRTDELDLTGTIAADRSFSVSETKTGVRAGQDVISIEIRLENGTTTGDGRRMASDIVYHVVGTDCSAFGSFAAER